MGCPAFGQDERCDEAIGTYVIAFAEDRGRGRRGRSRRKYEPRQQPLALGYNPALDEQRLAESHYSASEVGSVRPYGRGGGQDRERDGTIGPTMAAAPCPAPAGGRRATDRRAV